MERLASLIHQRNGLDAKIAEVIGRPALPGHFGEFVAAQVFGITLHDSATYKGNDGLFMAGPLKGKTVEIMFYTKNTGLLDMKTNSIPDFHLVLTGPRSAAESSRGKMLPWIIESVYLFDTVALTRKLQERNVKIGTATSVRNIFWDEAEIYPKQHNSVLELTPGQRELIALFGQQPAE